MIYHKLVKLVIFVRLLIYLYFIYGSMYEKYFVFQFSFSSSVYIFCVILNGIRAIGVYVRDRGVGPGEVFSLTFFCRNVMKKNKRKF